MPSFCFATHVTSASEPHVTHGDHAGQCPSGPFPLSQKICREVLIWSKSLQNAHESWVRWYLWNALYDNPQFNEGCDHSLTQHFPCLRYLDLLNFNSLRISISYPNIQIGKVNFGKVNQHDCWASPAGAGEEAGIQEPSATGLSPQPFVEHHLLRRCSFSESTRLIMVEYKRPPSISLLCPNLLVSSHTQKSSPWTTKV